jgi:hypothetical protein
MEEAGADGGDGGGGGDGGQGSTLGGAAAGADQGGSESWRDSLPEDMRNDTGLSKFSDVSGLAKSYMNLEQMLGRDKIPMPVTDEDWGGVYDRLGRPEEAAGYEMKTPEGVTFDETAQNNMRAMAHKMGLNQKQMEGMSDWVFTELQGRKSADDTSTTQALEESTAALKTEWGEKYDQNVNVALRAVEEFGGDELREFLNSSQVGGQALGNHPAMIKMLADIGGKMMESGKLEGSGTLMQTPEEMQNECNTLMAHPAYTDRRNPEHAQINKKVQALFGKIHGG